MRGRWNRLTVDVSITVKKAMPALLGRFSREKT
jgi:hypothetical protein